MKKEVVSMAENFDSEIFTLTDEEGNPQDFELLDQMEIGGENYYAFVPYYENPEEMTDADGELVVLKMEEDEDGEESLVTIDDDEEYERIGQLFLERLQSDYEE
ncbi:MAG: DUF1292 domain-containing protein [Oscillospiraceae bacterium]|nr:DUF1292 domain-containing protein [Oscillospiraceae bacterium]MBQ8978684.1 DUF1292 domain-containing protein [Oscillospiraceae bacterium]